MKMYSGSLSRIVLPSRSTTNQVKSAGIATERVRLALRSSRNSDAPKAPVVLPSLVMGTAKRADFLPEERL